MKNFNLEEFLRSNTAVELNIDNTPSKDEELNINELVDNLLDPLRDSWAEYCKSNNLGNGGITVRSGFRSNDLNKAVGGSKTSAHTSGWAADIVPSNGNMKKFQIWITEAIEEYNWDQLIYEKPRNGVASWIHIGLRNREGKQRKQKFTLV